MQNPYTLLLTEHYPPARGGMAQSCDRIVNGLRRSGVRLDVAHLTRRLRGLHVESQLGGRYVGFPLGDDVAHGLNLLWNHLQADPDTENYRTVMAFGGTVPLLAGPVLARWLGIPLVTLFRGNDFDAALFSPKRGDLLREAIGSSTAVAVVTREKKEKVDRIYQGTQSVWITNGVDLDSWRIVEIDRERGLRWRAEHVDDGRRVVGVIGQIKRKKGILFLLESLLRTQLVGRFHFLFVGDIDEEVGAFLLEHGDLLHYSTLPYIDRFNLLPSYAACDMIAIPSFYDGTPNVLVEAVSLGLPLLCSRAGGMGDVLVDGVHAFTFAPGNEHECRHALHRAANATDDEFRSLGDACHVLAMERFDAAIETEAYRRLLADAVHARPCPE